MEISIKKLPLTQLLVLVAGMKKSDKISEEQKGILKCIIQLILFDNPSFNYR